MSRIKNREAELKTALRDTSLTDQYIVQKFVTYGTPYLFESNESEYFDLKSEISSHFEERPENIYLVGSAKLGFSIAPRKLWRPFSDESDIDVVIISEHLFKSFWIDLHDFNISLKSRTSREDEKYKNFLKYFFRGWLRPDLFPFTYPITNEWFQYFKSLSYKKYEYRKVAAAIYFNFYFFESYHISNIRCIRNQGDLV